MVIDLRMILSKMRLDQNQKLTVIMWALPILGSGALLGARQYADRLYFSREEVEKAKMEYMAVRQSDLIDINARFEKMTAKIDTTSERLSGVREDMAGVKVLLQEQNRLLRQAIAKHAAEED